MKGLRFFLLLLAMGGFVSLTALSAMAQAAEPDNPVAQVRDQQSWEVAPFVNYGNGFGNRDQYKFFWAGAEFGKILTPVIPAGFATGQFQFAGNIMPLWQAYTPAPHTALYTCQAPSGKSVPCELPMGGGTFYGVSLTPVILRWNFLSHSHRWQPWFQGAGGLIYTTHKFPPNMLVGSGRGNWETTAAPSCGISRHKGEAGCTTFCGRSVRSIWE